jgi:PAS domain S-box-containing protein
MPADRTGVLARVGGRRHALLLIGVAALYLGAAKLGLELSVAEGVITPVWAPTGIALAATVLLGGRIWPAIAVGAFIANATSGAEVPVAAAIAVGNTLEAVAGAALLRRVDFRPQLDRVRDVFALVFFAAFVSTTISATNGVTTLLIAGDTSWGSYGSDWLLWWIGDGMGDLIVAPLLLVWATAPPRGLTRLRQAEGLALAALLVAVGCFVFLAGYWRYPHLLFPLLIWAALRFRQAGATAASFVVSAIAIAGAVHGSVPFGQVNATDTVQILEALLAGIAASLLILGAVLAERETVREHLAGAHASLAEAQEVAHIGSWEWNVPEDRITWSDELYRLYGLDPASGALTYETYLGCLHPEDKDMIQETVARARAEGSSFAFDHRVVLRDGAVHWLHGRGRAVRDGRGAVVRMLGTAQDITERKRVDELRDTILSTVSHELRTPLTAVLGFALTLRERGAQLGADALNEVVEHLTEQAQRLERLLSDLLDLERLRHHALTPGFRATDVGELATRVAAAYVDDDCLVTLRVEPVVADVDAPKVERIVENLLANAVKHTPPRTEIQVRVAADGDGVVLAVEDRGPGVPADQREAVFEVFTRGDGTEVPGTGVGLALVAQFAALHGGRAWVEENPGGGAAFRVRLPLRQDR